VTPLFRYEYVVPRQGVFPARQVNLAITRDGRILAGEDIGKAGYDATMIGQGDLVDQVMAAYLGEHSYGDTVTQLPEPDTSVACPIDGDLACGQGGALAMARHRILARQDQPEHRQNLLGPLVEVDLAGRVPPAEHHLVVAADQLGYDWRSTAIVHVDGGAVPYRAWWPSQSPDPGLPRPKLPPEPQPTVQTPSVVSAWVDTRVQIGALRLPGRLPDLASRRRIREEANLTQAKLAALVGCAESAVGNWERGERQPSGDLLERYAETLHRLRKVGLGDDHSVAGTPASPAITEPQEPTQPVMLPDDMRAQLANDVVSAVRSEHPQLDPDALLADVLAHIDKVLEQT
jgi:transcriptional regulator with XRE-family HTH domain